MAFGLFGALVGAWLFLPAGMILSSVNAWSHVLWSAFGPEVAPYLSGSASALPGASVLVTALIVGVPRTAYLAWRIFRFKRRLAQKAAAVAA